jgi:hypothetical protein
MTERLSKQRKAIQLYLMRQNRRDLDLAEGEWKLIEEFSLLLKPFDEITKMLCEDVAAISIQFPFAKMIHSNLMGLSVSSSLVALKKKMCELLEVGFF